LCSVRWTHVLTPFFLSCSSHATPSVIAGLPRWRERSVAVVRFQATAAPQFAGQHPSCRTSSHVGWRCARPRRAADGEARYAGKYWYTAGYAFIRKKTGPYHIPLFCAWRRATRRLAGDGTGGTKQSRQTRAAPLAYDRGQASVVCLQWRRVCIWEVPGTYNNNRYNHIYLLGEDNHSRVWR
jgi:hypothetical protein